MPRIVFVMSQFQNAFFVELAEAMVEALSAAGVASVRTADPSAHEVDADDVYVLLPPHEYVTLEGTGFIDDPVVAARTIGMSAEQPHQVFFERNAAVASRLGATLDFSPLAVAAYRRLGIDAVHQSFGYVPSWDRFDARNTADADSTTNVLYLGNKRPRRLETLAMASDALVEHAAVLRISDNAETNRASSPTFLAGEDKRRALASTRLLINIHQGDEAYFEWLRFADAAHCGVPVLTEASLATEPFADGVHFLSFAPGHLSDRLPEVLADDDRLAEVAAAAYDLLRQTPLSSTISALVEVATQRLVAPPPATLPNQRRREMLGRDRTDPAPRAAWRRPRRAALLELAGRRSPVAVAPDGVRFREPLTLPAGRAFSTCIVEGIDADQRPTLEGIWPWESWRLRHGQHLGRVLVVDPDLLAAVRRWITEPWALAHPHVAVQLFSAVHGVRGHHVPRPLASLHGVPLDPEQRLPDDVATRCRQILDGAG
ncbi:MAG: hypothetical protein WBP59_06920 [Ilumatobacteraceae bacterium]